MESWLGGNKGQKIILKERSRKMRPEVVERTNDVDMDEVEEVEDFNSNLQENPFKRELIHYEDISRKYNFLSLTPGSAADDDLRFLTCELTCHDNLDEPDVPWDFKTLRTEISAIISAIYDIK